METQKRRAEGNQKKPIKKSTMVLFASYGVFIAGSHVLQFEMGKTMGGNFVFFAADMLKLFPAAFVLVGLFMVWVDRETVERHFGEASGIRGYVVSILLACTTVAPFVVALPMAAALNKKGARLSVVLTYLGAAAICRIPMTIFEASFLGPKFTIIRYAVSLPLVVLSSLVVERLVGKDYIAKSGLQDSLEA